MLKEVGKVLEVVTQFRYDFGTRVSCFPRCFPRQTNK